MATPICSTLEVYIQQIEKLADKEILDATANAADSAQLAANKLAAITYWTAVKAQNQGFYAL